ncbi:MAG: hypothetical protein NT014_00070 [Candidatus Omnitrophica bacterium]|nr:hypothetical protein [Candidatus Omnitrophota bacterium]
MILLLKITLPILLKGYIGMILRLKVNTLPSLLKGVIGKKASNPERVVKSASFCKDEALYYFDTVILPTYQYIYRNDAW